MRLANENPTKRWKSRFERCYERVATSSKTVIIPEAIRAFMVLERASVTDTLQLWTQDVRAPWLENYG